MTTVMENCPNRIYLPNANAVNDASRELYKKFGCNAQQIRIIAQMTPKQDYYYSSIKGNRVFRLALQPMEIPFVTSTAKSDQQQIDYILRQYNREQFVEQWLKYKGYDNLWRNFDTEYLKGHVHGETS